MQTRSIIVVVFSFAVKIDAVPPESCFANFKWEDCGGPPVRVLYYWKPGSRCEVGIWRGCLPNMNMFKDEYECVSTCIFVARAQAQDYHELNHEDDIEATTGFDSTSDIESTTGDDGTTNTDVGSNSTTAVADVNSTSSDVNSTTT